MPTPESSSKFLHLPGLPPIEEGRYNQTATINCLNSKLFEKTFCDFYCGQFNIDLVKHIGEPIILSEQHTLNPNDHYLSLVLKECSGLYEAISSLKSLAYFVKKYEGIKWLFGTSWLGSIANGKLVERYGFHSTNIHVPKSIHISSQKDGLSKNNATPNHIKLVQQSETKLIYAQRDEFLPHFHV